ncbi:MAG: hypothetical protein HY904_00635 [Deltaproteobacteria bacterium]|nr:hypothetical protein [Deltaproteobacteria bacterium]
MKHSRLMALSAAVAAVLATTVAIAGDVTIPNTFSPGTTIRSAEVNANFEAVRVANNANAADIGDHGARLSSMEDAHRAVTGAYTVSALDFQPTVSGTTNVVRTYDLVGVDTPNSKIGAAIHPVDGGVPTRFSCYFTGPGVAFSGDLVRATLWSVSPSQGSVAMASLDMSAVFIAPTPMLTSTTSFVGRNGSTAMRNMIGTDYFRYLIELEFLGGDSLGMRLWGCAVEYDYAP